MKFISESLVVIQIKLEMRTAPISQQSHLFHFNLFAKIFHGKNSKYYLYHYYLII